MKNKDFGAVIFRRTIPEISNEGGLWDSAYKIYSLFNAKPNENDKQWNFNTGARITFAHMQYEKDKYSWKSAEIPLIEFDQLETFTASQFFYMLSRNRSMCGVHPYVRCSANPEPGWLADFLSWWIDDDGWAIPERSGIIRWMIRANDQTYWADTREELFEQHKNKELADDDPKQPMPKSVTFVLSTIYDNQILLEQDPNYLANLQALDYIDRQRLLGDSEHLGGNWKVKPAAGKVFNKAWFEIVDAVPSGGKELRFWDLAATASELADSTASCKAKIVNDIMYILEATNEQTDPARTDMNIKNTAISDGRKCVVRWEREGGSSGKRDAHHITTMLRGFDAKGVTVTKDKITRAKPLAAQAYVGNVKLLRGHWNERWLNSMHAQEGNPKQHDDDMDAASGCYNELINNPVARTGRSPLSR